MYSYLLCPAVDYAALIDTKASMYCLLCSHVLGPFPRKKQTQIHLGLMYHSLSLNLNDLVDSKSCVVPAHDAVVAAD